jgi:polyisoprenoid-binding protein YceI
MFRSNEQCSVSIDKRFWRCGLIGLALMGILVSPAFAQTAELNGNAYILNRERSKISFSISHFYVSSTEGQFTTFDGKLNFEPQAPEHGSATIHISSGSIDTGIAARDDHLRTADFFDAARFPVATFETTSLTQNSSTTGKLTGTLSLHGVTRPVSLNVTLLTPDLNADRLQFAANTTLKRSNFGMTNYMGVIGDDVTLSIEAEFDKER